MPGKKKRSENAPAQRTQTPEPAPEPRRRRRRSPTAQSYYIAFACAHPVVLSNPANLDEDGITDLGTMYCNTCMRRRDANAPLTFSSDSYYSPNYDPHSLAASFRGRVHPSIEGGHPVPLSRPENATSGGYDIDAAYYNPYSSRAGSTYGQPGNNNLQASELPAFFHPEPLNDPANVDKHPSPQCVSPARLTMDQYPTDIPGPFAFPGNVGSATASNRPLVLQDDSTSYGHTDHATEHLWTLDQLSPIDPSQILEVVPGEEWMWRLEDSEASRQN